MSLKQTEVTSKKIGETYFYIRPFPAFTAARVSGELSTTIAPILEGLAPILSGWGGDVLNTDVEKALPALVGALGRLDGNKLEHLLKELLIEHRNISYDDGEHETERLTYEAANEIFCMELADMILLCIEVVKLNFGSFFTKFSTLFGVQNTATEAVTAKLRGTKNGGR